MPSKRNKKKTAARQIGEGLRGYSTISMPSVSKQPSPHQDSSGEIDGFLAPCAALPVCSNLLILPNGRVQLRLSVCYLMAHLIRPGCEEETAAVATASCEPSTDASTPAEGRGIPHRHKDGFIVENEPGCEELVACDTTLFICPSSASEPATHEAALESGASSTDILASGHEMTGQSELAPAEVEATPLLFTADSAVLQASECSPSLQSDCEPLASMEQSQSTAAAALAAEGTLQSGAHGAAACSCSVSCCSAKMLELRRLHEQQQAANVLSASCSATSSVWPQLSLSEEVESQVEAVELQQSSQSDDEEGIMCAICHGTIQPLDVALVRDCDHPFCTCCILNWALQKKKCPLCQVNFSHIWLYRHLDGSFNDYLIEESVDLLHVAQWFKKTVAAEARLRESQDEDEDDYLEMLQYEFGGAREQDEDEAYYFAMQDGLTAGRRGGRPRAFGNRTWGAGGHVAVGRIAVRPSLPKSPPSKGKGKKPLSSTSGSPDGLGSIGAGASSSASAGDSGVSSSTPRKSGSSKKAEAKAAKAEMKDRRREMVQAKRSSSSSSQL